MKLIVDVMGTLVYDPFYREVPAFFGMSLEELLAVKHPTAWVEFELGRRSEASFLRDFFADGRSYDQEGLKRVTFESYRPLDGMDVALAMLAARHDAVHLMSNYPVWFHEVEARCRLARHASWAFVSCREGVRKPDRRAYERVLARIEAEPRECLFIDDSAANCEAARSLGLRAIHVTAPADLLPLVS